MVFFQGFDLLFSMYAQFLEKLTFLTPIYAHVSVRIRGKKYQFFGKFWVRSKWIVPKLNFLKETFVTTLKLSSIVSKLNVQLTWFYLFSSQCSLLILLKTLENLWFFDVFRGIKVEHREKRIKHTIYGKKKLLWPQCFNFHSHKTNILDKIMLDSI